MGKKKPKEYRIDSLDKLLNAATEENSERLAVDFAAWIMWYAQTMAETRKQYPEQTKGKSNTQIAKAAFLWTDDGKNEVTGVQIENASTGETTNIKFKN